MLHKKIMHLSLWVISTISLATFTGCESPMKSAKEAADTGKEIKTYNQKTMESMKLGASKEARDNAFKEALAAEKFDAKTIHTATYFNAMSFQLLGMMYENSIDIAYNRERLKADSVKEFLRQMKELMPSDYEFIEPSAVEGDNYARTLNAFVVAMHEINLSQYNNLQGQKNPDLQIESFFDVLAKSNLTLLDKDLNGEMPREELSLDDKEILRQHSQIVWLLKLRYKALFTVALGRMSHITRYDDDSKFFKDFLKFNWLKKLKLKIDMRYFSWTPKKMGTEETAYINDIFARANTTKALLEKIGYEAELDEDVREIFNHMVWPVESIQVSTSTSSGKSNYLAQAQAKLKENLESIR